MKISIQQPEFFPWLGFFNKAIQVDKIVLLDDVQYKKRYFENRNRIRTWSDWAWLRIPVITKGRYKQNINEVRIDNSQKWQKKMSETLRYNYSNALYWRLFSDELLDIIYRPYVLLVDFNIEIINLFNRILGINVPIEKSSLLNLDESGSNLILEICKQHGARTYLSGKDGRNYLNETMFQNHHISLEYQKFSHPVYSQIHGEFISHMSVVDLCFNYGLEASKFIESSVDI